MRFADCGGFTTHYALEGREGAPVILFANSVGTDFRIWDDVAAVLREDYRLLRYDMRGHGLTDVVDGPYSMAQLAEDCVQLLDALNIEQVHVCGLSIGGMVAQQLAAVHPQRIRSAIFCDTAMRIGTVDMWNERARAVRQDGMASIADGVLQRWFTDAFLARGVAGYHNMFCRIPAEGYAGCCEAIRDADLTAQASTIRVPSLAIVGEADVATPPDAVAALAAAVADCRFKSLASAGHIPCIEQPRALAATLQAFLHEVEHG
ncbi:MAG: 3-oxoadipate enol-lactonase [Aquisalimonadaceae bacterium]